MSDEHMQGLPVFGYLEQEDQVAQLIDLFTNWGIDGMETTGNVEVDVPTVVHNCAVVASKAESDSEVEMVLNSIVSLIVPLPAEKARSVVRDFCGRVCAEEFLSDSGRSGAVTRVLTNLLHGFKVHDRGQRALQFDILLALLRVASKTGQLTQVPTDLKQINDWFDGSESTHQAHLNFVPVQNAEWDEQQIPLTCQPEGDSPVPSSLPDPPTYMDWGVNVDKRREALRLLHQALLKNTQETDAAAKMMVELLSTYTDADANKATEDARSCIRSAIADPNCLLFDHFLQLLPVKSLEKSDPPMFALLNIFVKGSLEDFLKFHQANANFVTGKLELDLEAVVHKMRILTLMSIGEQERQVSFDDLASKLKLDHGEALEDFIIQATHSKAVKAKMDQLRGKVIVTSVAHRQFERRQWELLKTKLDAWSANLKQAKVHLDSVKHVETHG